MKFRASMLSLTGLALLCPALAHAHISIASGPAAANTTQEIAFGVGHGCEGADTYSVRVEMPAGVSSIRPINGVFGKAVLEKDSADVITAVTWTKQDIDVLPADEQYYKLSVRLKVADQPFTTLYFPTTQICRDAEGNMTTVEWISMTEGGDAEPAPALIVLPARRAGWNKFTVPNAVADLAPFFPEAQIVWKGSAAYSANPTTAELISGTDGVTTLSKLAAGDEIWVKY